MIKTERNIAGLPLHIRERYDPYADDSDKQPWIDETDTTVGETFNQRQVEILAKLTGRINLDPIAYSVRTNHQKFGYIYQHYTGWVGVYGVDKETHEHKLISKSVSGKGQEGPDNFYRWQKPAGWIEESDLKEEQ